MNQKLKHILRDAAQLSPVPVTKNLRYDRETQKVLKRTLHPHSNCIDVGCHKGEILDVMLKYAPKGSHSGFEPIPYLYSFLSEKYYQKCKIYPIALSNQKGLSSFNFVITNPSYSGLKKRNYDRKGEKDRSIMIETDTLDNIIAEDFHVDLIKIDVEGAEMLVIEGALNTIRRCKPIIIFEFGKGASDVYKSTPEMLYKLITETLEMQLSTMKKWLSKSKPITLETLKNEYQTGNNYYFIAYP
jgi:FkbM family methyltransferase